MQASALMVVLSKAGTIHCFIQAYAKVFQKRTSSDAWSALLEAPPYLLSVALQLLRDLSHRYSLET